MICQVMDKMTATTICIYMCVLQHIVVYIYLFVKIKST